jgi:hypothetical protein
MTLIALVPIARYLAIMVVERPALLIGLYGLAVRLIRRVHTLTVCAVRTFAGGVRPTILSTILRYGCLPRHDEEGEC